MTITNELNVCPICKGVGGYHGVYNPWGNRCTGYIGKYDPETRIILTEKGRKWTRSKQNGFTIR